MAPFATRWHISVAGLLLALAPLAARADATPSSDAPAACSWQSVAPEALAERRGGLSLESNDVRATVIGNSVGAGSETGQVNVSGGAFSATRGITSNIINTGNNVSIQSTLHVVIDLH